MNNHLLLSALRARYRILLLVLGVTVLVTTLVSLFMPKTYVATAAMLVDNKTEQSMSNSVETNVRERTGYMQTQIDLINSQKVARMVVSELGLPIRPEARSALEEAFEDDNAIEDRLAESLLKRLKVDTSQSSVINIAFSSNDAVFSALVANAFAKAYMDTALELRVEPSRQTAAWFDEQIKGLRNNLEQALARLTDYQKEKGIVTLDERQDADSLLTSLGRASNDAGRQQRVLRQADAGATGDFVINSTTVRNQKARADLARAEARLHEFETRLGSSHPSYQRQLALTESLRMEVGKTAGFAAQQRQQHDAEVRDARLAQQARVFELRQYRNQVGVLMRDVEIAQKAYEIAMQRSVDKRVESRASLTNVSLLNPAAVPFKAARPRVGVNITLSAIVGALLGLCIIYLLEMFDRRVRSYGDLENEWGIPLLAELNVSHPAHARLSGPSGSLPVLPSPG
jgi:chain length determinant protein EpsF